MRNYHLVILKKPYLDAILNGTKTVESRFTITNRPPFGRISIGDKLFLKLSSGPVRATANVSKLKSFDNLTPKTIEELKKQFNQYILAANEYWLNKLNSNFGVLIWLKDVKTIKPRTINKKDWRAWVLLTEKQNFGLFNARTGFS